MTGSVPKPGPRVLIMLDEDGRITAAHTNDHVQVLCIQETPSNDWLSGVHCVEIKQAPGDLSGKYTNGPGFDNLVRQHFVNRVFKLFGR